MVERGTTVMPEWSGPSVMWDGGGEGASREMNGSAIVPLPVHVRLVRRETAPEDMADASPDALADWTRGAAPWETCEVEVRAGRVVARCCESFPAGLMDEETRRWFEGHAVAVALDRLRRRIARFIKR